MWLCSDDSEPSSYPAHIDPIVWDFICQYATGTMSLPTAESSLQAHLGNRYVNSDWQPVLKVVMESEDDNAVLDAVSTLYTAASSHTGIKIRIPAQCTTSDSEPTQKPTQLVSAELEVMESVHHLREWNCIHGKPSSVDEIIEPPEERDIPESILDGGVKVIADEVCWEMAIANGEIIDVDEDDKDDKDDASITAALPRSKLIQVCRQLEAGCMHYGGDPQFSVNLSHDLIKYRTLLQQEEFLTAKQTTLDMFFKQ